jgi:two-component system nitrogen regulation response regulator GlnG
MLEVTRPRVTHYSAVRSLLTPSNLVRISGQESEKSANACVRKRFPLARTAHVFVIGDRLTSTSQQLSEDFAKQNQRVHFTCTGVAGLEEVRSLCPDVILLDADLPDRRGLDVYQQIRRIDPSVSVIFVSAAGQPDMIIEAIRQGAYDYLEQPLEFAELRRVVSKALDLASEPQLLAEADELRRDLESEAKMVGSCPAMQAVYKLIGHVVDKTFPVLITGESGTGKELVARAIHRHGPRFEMPFLALNCAAIPENLLESELFGHEKGAFTGAHQRRIGKFEQCDGGVILLDEIGDIPLSLQARVLRLLQNQCFERVGGNETIRTDVRILAATHRDLKLWSAAGKFRFDLYYRLNVVPIQLPPLRERGSDLPLLVKHFLSRLNSESGGHVRSVSPEALERLRTYSWPGNIRELESVLRQALLRAGGSVLLQDSLSDLMEPPRGSADLAAPAEAFIKARLRPGTCDLHGEIHEELDRHVLPCVMKYVGGNQRRAAALLGIARQTLRAKLRDLINPPGPVPS